MNTTTLISQAKQNACNKKSNVDIYKKISLKNRSSVKELTKILDLESLFSDNRLIVSQDTAWFILRALKALPTIETDCYTEDSVTIAHYTKTIKGYTIEYTKYWGYTAGTGKIIITRNK